MTRLATGRTLAIGRRLAIVGSGVAGLFGAISAAEAGADVVLLTKARLGDSNSMFAQGGFAAVLPEGQHAPGDSVESHVADTIAAGAALGTRSAVEAMCARASRAVDALLAHGVVFDRDADGRLALGLEAAHSFPRVLHAGGDASGAGITRALIARLRGLEAAGRVRVIEGAKVTDVMIECGAVAGVEFAAAGESKAGANGPGARRRVAADAVLLATGGAGQLFSQTTNPAVATGDGVALSFRAGATLRDLEFYQFHPTALQIAGPDGVLRSSLVSEAVRGEGAVIRDASGRRFVADYHPLGELAPRDAVSRALALHRRAGGGQAYLDATGLEAARGRGFLAQRFPGLDAMTRAAGYDWRRDLLPIGPAAHYWMGGVATDLDGATSVPGLYAAGEVACTGVHGANRLASNSLLEGVVFAARAVERFVAAAGGAWRRPEPRAASLLALDAEPDADARELVGPEGRAELAAVMEADASVLRDAEGLARAATTLAGWRSDDPETANLLVAGRLLVAAAGARDESVGAHYRLDFPGRRPRDGATEAGIDVVRETALAGRSLA
ncbi:L-aspartate oxidase [Sinomonas sp. ASV322]|uniref:L-aspartate oxidase n=1 Tax=Sinomonas sp. ASV322 TaxID=3041920 RepID=UPI0027DE3515|nr:L-aspartate oxidase [Sinomonas sp. ASV322]MDQ4502134.1 L-aspartate oxidase [Sinomonas sp. ASV322]